MQFLTKTNKKLKLKVDSRLSKHYLGTLVTNDSPKLLDGAQCLDAVQQIIKKHEVVCLGEQLYRLPNDSFTLLVALSESHISIHTWPEKQAVQLDVFLCNYLHNNTKKCEAIYEDIVAYFDSVESNTTVIERP
jgi:S-adenosylmethionine decarboxylase